MDPHDILGIKTGSDWKVIRHAYKKMLIATHPDKMGGDARYFMMVHEAYNQLVKEAKVVQRDAPKQSTQYSSQIPETVQPRKMENFTSSGFNQFFEQNRMNTNNPFQRGYSKKMEASSKNREDPDGLIQKQCKIKKEEVIIYKEPESAYGNGAFENCYEFGVNRVNDFSSSRGTDYMQAYSERAELVDTVKRYKDHKELIRTRKNADYKLSKEDREYQKELEQKKHKLEQYRRNKYLQNDQLISQQYTKINSRLK